MTGVTAAMNLEVYLMIFSVCMGYIFSVEKQSQMVGKKGLYAHRVQGQFPELRQYSNCSGHHLVDTISFRQILDELVQ